MNNTAPTGDITGKINANPNPLFFGQRCVISWETNDPAGAEIRLSTGTDNEKLVTRGGSSGHVEIPWIKDAKAYEFRLYVGNSPGVAIDSVRVRRDIDSAPAALREIADEVKRGNIRDVRALSIHCGGDAALSPKRGTSRVVPELGETRVPRYPGYIFTSRFPTLDH